MAICFECRFHFRDFVPCISSPLRAWLINSIPRNLKLGMAAGSVFSLR